MLKNSMEKQEAEKQKEIDLLKQQLEDEKTRFNEAIAALNQAAEEIKRSKAAIEVTVRNEPKEGE